MTHPFPTRIPRERLLFEVLEDRKRLEALTGGLVDGLAYPNGDWNAEVIQGLMMCGIRYARTTQATNGFGWKPEDWLAWHPTCHDRAVTPDSVRHIKALALGANLLGYGPWIRSPLEIRNRPKR